VGEAARLRKRLTFTRRLRFDAQRVLLLTYDGEALVAAVTPRP
jgi:hypothetical protein